MNGTMLMVNVDDMVKYLWLVTLVMLYQESYHHAPIRDYIYHLWLNNDDDDINNAWLVLNYLTI
jgi:hypothetical protein